MVLFCSSFSIDSAQDQAIRTPDDVQEVLDADRAVPGKPEYFSK